MEPTGLVAVLELRFWGRTQWPPATNPIAIGTTPASVSASRSSRQPRKRKICSCRWPKRGGDWLTKPRARERRTPIELNWSRLSEMSPQDTHNNTQQDQGDKTPKYPSPRLMPAAVDRGFFGFLTHEATANSTFSISIGSSSSARKLLTRHAAPNARVKVIVVVPNKFARPPAFEWVRLLLFRPRDDEVQRLVL
jgi:hypothetical protein